MLTETFLNKVVTDNIVSELLFSQPDFKEAEWINYVHHCFVREHLLEYESKPITHYQVDIEHRTIFGLLPMSIKEFAIYVVYATLILYINPSIEVSFDYVRLVLNRLSKFDTAPAIEWLEKLISQYSQLLADNPVCGPSGA